MNRSFLALTAMAALLASCASSKIPKERQVTVQTKLNFKKQSAGGADAYYTLEMVSDGDERSIYWPEDAPGPGALSKGRSYTVELLEEEYGLGMGGEGASYWSPELFRLSDGDRLLYDASVCRVHGAGMKRAVVPISYGFPMFERSYSTAMESEFPNAGVVLGGCCVNRERPSTHAWVCPRCVENKRGWEKENPKTNF